MRPTSYQSALLLGITSLSLHPVAARPAKSAGVGNSAAQEACEGFPANVLKCLTDVSFVLCPPMGGIAVEQFVAAGTRCAQGIPGQKFDAIEGVPATDTRSYSQADPSGKRIKSGARAQPTTTTVSSVSVVSTTVAVTSTATITTSPASSTNNSASSTAASKIATTTAASVAIPLTSSATQENTVIPVTRN